MVDNIQPICLSYDLLLHIFEVLYSDYESLYRCSLVNWEFNQVASKLLYAQVQYSPSDQGPTLNLKDRGTLPVSYETNQIKPQNILAEEICISGAFYV